MTCRVNSDQEKVMERVLNQRSEVCTPAEGDTALRDQKKYCSWANAMGAGACEAYRMIIRKETQGAIKSQLRTRIFR